VAATDITDVVCSHFHADHVGWLFDLSARPVFPRAAIWFGHDDWHHFVTGSGEMAPHIREGFRSPALASHLHSIGDVDPALADRTCERLWHELKDGHTTGVGAHFPELRLGRVLAGTARRWLS
jgi:glyoxylase-like metal-dependent hydrolase (beta-lactamase superfamily II)